jgi:hypothetical protein
MFMMAQKEVNSLKKADDGLFCNMTAYAIVVNVPRTVIRLIFSVIHPSGQIFRVLWERIPDGKLTT